MRYLAAILISTLGLVQCVIADYESQHSWSGPGIDPHEWNLLGSVFLGVGLAGFVAFGLLDIWVTRKTLETVKRRF